MVMQEHNEPGGLSPHSAYVAAVNAGGPDSPRSSAATSSSSSSRASRCPSATASCCSRTSARWNCSGTGNPARSAPPSCPSRPSNTSTNRAPKKTPTPIWALTWAAPDQGLGQQADLGRQQAHPFLPQVRRLEKQIETSIVLQPQGGIIPAPRGMARTSLARTQAFSSPKGPSYDSPGQRPGYAPPRNRALKRRHKGAKDPCHAPDPPRPRGSIDGQRGAAPLSGV